MSCDAPRQRPPRRISAVSAMTVRLLGMTAKTSSHTDSESLISYVKAASPFFYSRSKTRMFGSLRPGWFTVIVKLFPSSETLTSCVFTTFPPILAVSSSVLAFSRCPDDMMFTAEP